MKIAGASRRGLLLDFGGVLTSDFFRSISNHCERLGLPRDRFRQLVTTDPAGRRVYHQVERGEISQPVFERQAAELLGVDPEGLVKGLLADLRPDHQIIAAAARARAAGVRVGVLTNSWGTRPFDPYAGYRLTQRFDAVIISGEVGIRKPDPRVYRLAAARLGVAPASCVFVDDLGSNLRAAAAVGMATVLHVDAITTITELERLLHVPLR